LKTEVGGRKECHKPAIQGRKPKRERLLDTWYVEIIFIGSEKMHDPSGLQDTWLPELAS